MQGCFTRKGQAEYPQDCRNRATDGSFCEESTGARFCDTSCLCQLLPEYLARLLAWIKCRIQLLTGLPKQNSALDMLLPGCLRAESREPPILMLVGPRLSMPCTAEDAFECTRLRWHIPRRFSPTKECNRVAETSVEPETSIRVSCRPDTFDCHYVLRASNLRLRLGRFSCPNGACTNDAMCDSAFVCNIYPELRSVRTNRRLHLDFFTISSSRLASARPREAATTQQASSRARADSHSYLWPWKHQRFMGASTYNQ